jgi:chromosome segregation ATPase
MAHISATGYVDQMLDKDQSFQQFTMSCARAFGALISMRDDDMDASIPEQLEGSSYYQRRIAETKAQIAKLAAISDQQKLEYGKRCKADQLATLQRSLEAVRIETAKCRAMLEQVEAWEPPSKDHQELKSFMIKQLNESHAGTEDDYYVRALAETEAKPELQFLDEEINALLHNIEYYTEDQKEEEKRLEDCNEWLRLLRDSLKQGRLTAA